MREVKNEKKKVRAEYSKTILIILSVLIAILFIYLGVVAWSFYFNDRNLSEDDNVVQNLKKIKLDTNSDLVQALYNKVSKEQEGTYPANWMISQYKDTFGDFIVEEATEEDKMRLVAHNMDEDKLRYLSTVEVAELNLPVMNNKGQYAQYGNKSTVYYKKSYIKDIYKRLYGDDSKFDTSINIIDSIYEDTYTYIPVLDGYLKYESIGKGGVGPSDNTIIELVDAFEKENIIELYENIYLQSYDIEKNTYGEKTKQYTFKYTFEKDNDIYKFISRKKI